MNKLIIRKYDNIPQYGTWGVWSYGNEHGTFGRSRKGMWAQLDGNIFLGLETYEDRLTARFKKLLAGWRELNAKFRIFNKDAVI